MNKLDNAYFDLIREILYSGSRKYTRNGSVLSVFGKQISHDMADGFPAITTKKLAFKSVVGELLWFLSGQSDIRKLWDVGCSIWDGDWKVRFNGADYPNTYGPADSLKEFYLNGTFDSTGNEPEIINKLYDLGPIYGPQWVRWDNRINQIDRLVNLLRTDPDSRRMLVSAWNLSELDDMVLPPCHYSFQVWTRMLTVGESEELVRRANLIDMPSEILPQRKISLLFNLRSSDVPLGLPFNIASYAVLLSIFGKLANMIPDKLIANIGDAHIYENQINAVISQVVRDPYPLPMLELPIITEHMDMHDVVSKYSVNDFKLRNYSSHPAIKIPLSN